MAADISPKRVLIVAITFAVLVCAALVLCGCARARRARLHPSGAEHFVDNVVSLKQLVALSKKYRPSYVTAEQYQALDVWSFRAFNPGGFQVDGEVFVVVRLCNFTSCAMQYHVPDHIVSILVVVGLQSGRMAVVDVGTPDFYTQHGLEDAKCVLLGDVLHIFCTFIDYHGHPRMCVVHTPLNALLDTLGRGAGVHEFDAHPLYVPSMRLRPVEKNWMPFTAGGRLYVVYTLEPCVVLAVDQATWSCALTSNRSSGVAMWELIRGTSNVIDYGEDKLCLGHYRNEDDFQYYHVFVRLSSDPFRMRILQLSYLFKFQRQHRIEFANGLVAQANGDVYVTFGTEDCSCSLMRISKARLNAMFEDEVDGVVYLVDD